LQFHRNVAKFSVDFDESTTSKRSKSGVTIRGGGRHREIWIQPDGDATRRTTVSGKGDDTDPVSHIISEHSNDPALVSTQIHIVAMAKCG